MGFQVPGFHTPQIGRKSIVDSTEHFLPDYHPHILEIKSLLHGIVWK